LISFLNFHIAHFSYACTVVPIYKHEALINIRS
jgi:hypothetical protein